MPPTARCSANIPRSAGSICRSRRFRSSSSTRSSPPRTRISTNMAASTFPAWRAPRCCTRRTIGSNRRPQGASTITQQVAKNFLLTNEVSFTRKIKEALLAMRIERAYSKDKILELYLNEIYLGLGAYGIAAASLVYFDKSVNELTVAEAAYLAALPKAPARAASGAQPRPRRRAAQLRDRPPAGKRLDQAGRRRQGAQGSADRHQPRPTARISLPANISPRKSAATSSSATARRSSMKAACRFAPRSIRRSR